MDPFPHGAFSQACIFCTPGMVQGPSCPHYLCSRLWIICASLALPLAGRGIQGIDQYSLSRSIPAIQSPSPPASNRPGECFGSRLDGRLCWLCPVTVDALVDKVSMERQGPGGPGPPGIRTNFERNQELSLERPTYSVGATGDSVWIRLWRPRQAGAGVN